MEHLLSWLEKRRVLIGSVISVCLIAIGVILAWIDWHPPKTEVVTSRKLVRESTQLTSPAVSPAPSADASQPVSKSQSSLININTASLTDLDSLPGIGPVYAQRIIDYRSANGPFRAINDLVKVKGIGQSTLTKVKEKVTTGGQ